MRYEISFYGRAVPTVEPDELAVALEAHFDDVMEELLRLESAPGSQVTDGDVSAQLATGEVEISVVVDASDPDEAISVGMGAIRAAIHAANGHTPDWKAVPSATWALEYEGSEQKPLDLTEA